MGANFLISAHFNYILEHFSKIVDYNSFIYKKTQKEIIDVVRYEDSNDLKMSCSGLTSDFYMIAFKQNMSDLKWFGNTEYDKIRFFVFHKT
jgi:hypothetical protein